ncbi:bis(5-nucleosyl)-tetraphosphatase [Sporothrix brasiliensis 5110]|uniref:Bis(5-nucleosyl)-tetraphosphatase n=1 Tax=Sporothrix brasiliensis 5110 TaxID=1398154 RepID=A0A0C2IJH3_9PEZI|nr:bis(5-nucleosyl)-tetraphosphatase [Sporothrix brasiliensis 5110]KIH89301.1 bis(5-nucleosyl)-tetraphosphatase [Sporothrix brasiliensis 5110]
MPAVPANLPDLVRAAFVRARAAGDLTFFPTQVALLRVQGVPFQLRFAPALAKKPKAESQREDTKDDEGHAGGSDKKPYDPFEAPPPGLVVCPAVNGGTHRLVLNKFAVSQDHAILATTAWRPQSHLLAPADLAAAYACIAAYAARGEALYVFYNSGRHSGASQPHRHLQLLPVAPMRAGLAADAVDEWQVLADKLLDDHAAVPFYVAAARIRGDDGDDGGDGDNGRAPSAEQLHATYLDLYRQARAAAHGTAAVVPGASGADVDAAAEEAGAVPASISYNLALTHRTMALLPRTAEGGADRQYHLSLNGTVLAGTALVKNEAEWDALRSDPGRLGGVLAQIGVSPTEAKAGTVVRERPSPSAL